MDKITNCISFDQSSLKQPQTKGMFNKFDTIITTIFNKICFDLNSKKYDYNDIQWLASLMSVNKATFQEMPKVLSAINKKIKDQFALTAIQNGYPLVLRVLLDAGLNPNHSINIYSGKYYNNHCLISHAVYNGHTNIVRLLVHSKANVNTRDDFFHFPDFEPSSYRITLSPFLLAASKGHINIAQVLQEAGADIAAQSETGGVLTTAFNVLYSSRKERLGEVIEALLKMGCDVNALETFKSTPLMNAIWFTLNKELQTEHVNALQLLIQAGASIQAANSYNQTILMCAVASGHPEIVQMVLEGLKSIRGVSSSPSLVDVPDSNDFANPQLVKKILKARNSISGETALNLAKRLVELRAGEAPYIYIRDMLVEAHRRVEAQLQKQSVSDA